MRDRPVEAGLRREKRSVAAHKLLPALPGLAESRARAIAAASKHSEQGLASHRLGSSEQRATSSRQHAPPRRAKQDASGRLQDVLPSPTCPQLGPPPLLLPRPRQPLYPPPPACSW
jgi:hypothetical protein